MPMRLSELIEELQKIVDIDLYDPLVESVEVSEELDGIYLGVIEEQ